MGAAGLDWDEDRSGWSLTSMLRDVALRCACSDFEISSFIWRDATFQHTLKLTLMDSLMGWVGHSGFWMGAADIPPAVPCLAVRIWMLRVCPVGCVGWQATQPGSTRTLSPSVHEGRRWARWHRLMGQTVKLRGNSEGQRYRHGVATSHDVVAWACISAGYRASR